MYKHKANTLVSHCGFIVNAGTRDELPHESGMAHFLEHMLFKGTLKRKYYHILKRVDEIGGYLDGFTTKEKTGIHASFLTQYFERSVELLTDIMFNSVFPEKEFLKEKTVVIEELNSYKDSFDDSLYDDFEDLMFKGHPLGTNILGNVNSVNGFTVEDLKAFFAKHYTTGNMVFSYVGNMPIDKFKIFAEKSLGSLPIPRGKVERSTVTAYKPFAQIEKKAATQAYCVMGNRAYAINNDKETGLFLLNSILGGDNLNSRLHLNIREKHGWVYAIDSEFSAYCDTGVFAISFSSDYNNLKKVVAKINTELNRLINEPVSSQQLAKTKQMVINKIIMADESNINSMVSNARSVLEMGRIETNEEVFEKIANITATDLQEISNEIFDPKLMSHLIYEPSN